MGHFGDALVPRKPLDGWKRFIAVMSCERASGERRLRSKW